MKHFPPKDLERWPFLLYWPLAVKLAADFYRQRGGRVCRVGMLERCDLEQVGFFALKRAWETFDSGRGVRFTTYAWKVVWSAFQDEFRRQRYLSPPRPEKVYGNRPTSPYRGADGYEVSDDGVTAIVRDDDTADTIEAVAAAVARLKSPRQRRVLVRLYGLDRKRVQSQGELARRMHLTKQSISLYKRNGERTLRRLLKPQP